MQFSLDCRSGLLVLAPGFKRHDSAEYRFHGLGGSVYTVPQDADWLDLMPDWIARRVPDASRKREGKYSIVLSGTPVSDDDLLLLRDLNRPFRLYLNNTPITDEGLAHLHGLRHLRDVELHSTMVTPHGVRLLKERCPDANVRGP